MNSQGDPASVDPHTTHPAECANGCGFWAGNPAQNGLCSKCYNDEKMMRERKASAQAAYPAPSSPLPLPLTPTSQSTPEVSPAPVAAASSEEPVVASVDKPDEEMFQRPAQRPGRCYMDGCNKKVGLTGFKCRCEYVFCGAHRLAEAHKCDFDYKTVGRQQLAEINPLIQAAKMDKL